MSVHLFQFVCESVVNDSFCQRNTSKPPPFTFSTILPNFPHLCSINSKLHSIRWLSLTNIQVLPKWPHFLPIIVAFYSPFDITRHVIHPMACITYIVWRLLIDYNMIVSYFWSTPDRWTFLCFSNYITTSAISMWQFHAARLSMHADLGFPTHFAFTNPRIIAANSCYTSLKVWFFHVRFSQNALIFTPFLRRDPTSQVFLSR